MNKIVKNTLCKDQCILNNLIHYFSTPLQNGFV